MEENAMKYFELRHKIIPALNCHTICLDMHGID